MKRIVLTPVIEGYADDFLRDLKALADKPEDRLLDLINNLYGLPGGYADYIHAIRLHYDEIITATSDEMNVPTGHVHSFFFAFGGLDLSITHTISRLQPDGTTKQETKKFYQWVTDALGYDDVQEKIFPKYIKKMGIKSCVYCNAQYAISAKKRKTESGKAFRSTYTLDHYLPKSKYPYLATSFFNLYPACGSCNQSKSSRPPLFQLYVKTTDPAEQRNPFVFSLDKSSFVKYSMTGNADDLKIKFGTRSGISEQEAIDYENYFHVEKLYGNLNDTVEEVIWKSRVYNKAGRKALFESFGHLLPHKSDWNRFVLGNYDKEEDVMKRPLSKLVQDVAKQLDII